MCPTIFLPGSAFHVLLQIQFLTFKIATGFTYTMLLWPLLPVFLAAVGICGFWVVFAMAVTNGSVNVTEVFPYISTCGAYPPQSCVFGQILNLGAFLGKQYNQLEVHVTGAFLAFVIGNLYFWIQTFLTHKVKPRHGGSWILPLRFFLSLCGSILFISTVALFFLQLHSEAAYCEWALAIDLFLLFGLFAVDFQHIGGCSIHLQPRYPEENFPSVQISVQTLSL
ncbi:PREDICTED: transmembrane protein 150B [Thamnophis sirtalis]|uniref:Transmembrane protein 150B n=1 Tax=Thamnophis sirtalis TaxID=35019 RepID=A0A6I9Y1S8_9SAUR|nr:PREDICTED: transmembrane protein 150B [Thamnophis sirtalis]